MSPRLFVSIDLDERLHPSVARVQELFADISGVRLTDPSQVHVTLKFLGEVDEERIDDVIDALARGVAKAEVEAFRAELGNFGVFPEFDYISVIWIGVPVGGSEMEQLHHAIEDEVVALGIEEEGHTFTPHATIARMDHGAGKQEVQRIIQEERPAVGEMLVSEVRLTESILTAGGPRYETVARVGLPK